MFSSKERTRFAVIAALLVGTLAPIVSAQATSATQAPSKLSVVIFAEASAKEVRFEKQPELHVRLMGGLDSIHVLERRNLPSPVVAGTTYRDVYVAVQIFGRLNAECISNTLTGNKPKLDCASLELRGTTRAPTPPDSSTNNNFRR